MLTNRQKTANNRANQAYWMLHGLAVNQGTCPFCGESLVPDNKRKNIDQLTIHHIDFSGQDKLANQTIAHRSCHRRFHVLVRHERDKLGRTGFPVTYLEAMKYYEMFSLDLTVNLDTV